MKCKIVFLAALVFVSLRGVLSAQTDWVRQSNDRSRPVLELLAKYNPESAGRFGLSGFDDQILDLRENIYERTRDDVLRVLADLEGSLQDDLHPKVKQDVEILIQVLKDGRERSERRRRLLIPYFNVTEVVFESMRAILDVNIDPSRHPNAVVRLRKYAGIDSDDPPIVEHAKARSTERFAVDGLIGPYRVKLRKDIANSQRYLDGIADLMQKHGMEGWQPAHQAFSEQIRGYNRWLETEMLPRGRDDHRLPPELYTDSLQAWGIRIGPAELIERAQFGYLEIRHEMQAIARRIAAEREMDDHDYRAVIAALKKEQLAVDEILPVYEECLKEIEAIIRREQLVTLPKRDARIRFATAAESVRIPAPSMKPPPLIGNRGEFGEFLIPLSNPNAETEDKMDDFLHRSITWSLTAHEARPGHEMQFSAMIENGVSVTRAVFAWNSANVEGWGLYAEAMMKEHLPLEGQFFTLYMRLLRAARAFLDPMVNLGQMEVAEAKAFLIRELKLSEPMAAQEVDRYTYRMPGQAPAYYFGLMNLMSLRTQAELELKQDFNEKDFHDFILSQGLLPPELLRKAVLAEFVPMARSSRQESEA